jgi:hypothetical protein
MFYAALKIVVRKISGRDGTMIDDCDNERWGEIVQFGRRPIPPRACVVDKKTHVRMFLADMLDELGFIAREADMDEIGDLLGDFRPDLIVLGPLASGLDVQSLLRTLQAQSTEVRSCCSTAAARRPSSAAMNSASRQG